MYVECLCKIKGRSEEETRVFSGRRLRPVNAILPDVNWEELRVSKELDDAPGLIFLRAFGHRCLATARQGG